MAVDVTNTKIIDFQKEIVETANAATSTVASTAEDFTITPSTEGSKTMFRITEGSGSAGAIAYSVAGGTQWGGAVAYTGSVAQGTSEVFVLDTAKYVNDSHKIVITLSPTATKKLLTDHEATMAVYNVL